MYSKFSSISDTAWLALLKRSIGEQAIDGVKFPGFPDEATQVLFTSHKWEAALDEAYAFFKIAKSAAAEYDMPLGERTRYLDFGVGWARITRMFLKELDPRHISGVDVTPEILDICRNLMPVGEYKLSVPHGPLDYEDASFDLVTAFSVFSHLSPENGNHWLRELFRVLRPGGLAVITTLSGSFVDLCKDVATNPESSDWAKMMADAVTASYPNWSNQLTNFPKNEMLYLSTGGGFETLEPHDYGWAMIQEAYARKHWSEWFDVVQFIDNPKILAQACIILRRK